MRSKASFESTGAKKGFVIGCAEKVPENYANISLFFEKTQVDKIGPIYVNDCKMNNILSGLQSNSCKFLCVYGECTKIKKVESGFPEISDQYSL